MDLDRCFDNIYTLVESTMPRVAHRATIFTLFTETANSILTIIWITLCHHLETKNPETLTITIDGKSTGMLVIFVCFPLFGFVFFFIDLLTSRSQLFAVSFHGAHRSRT
jgi:hypothetical protein